MKQKQWKTIGVLVLASMLVAWGLASPAAAMEAKLSGQVNHMVTIINDGDKEDTFITDNTSSSTRFRFTAEEDLGSVKAGTTIEYEGQVNPSDKVDIDYDDANADDAGDSPAIKERVFEAYLKTNFGTMTIGQGSGAADGTSETDLSGTSVIFRADPKATAGNIEWKDENGNGTGVTIADTRNNFDGLSRNERIRYDTPSFAGFTASASLTNGDAYEGALRYSAEIYGKLAAAIGYIDTGDRKGANDYTQFSGSVSWLAPFGLNLTVAYGTQSYEDGATKEDLDPTNLYLKVGYIFGIHAVALEYGANEEYLAESTTSSNYGLAYVVKPWKPVELYAAYRLYMLDVDDDYYADDIENITQLMAGMRIKF